ncbi:MAG TPA: crosslink repair DNA glycosylase YcaQ family protein [Anaerolineales bacterium]|nr:crosslink repair DNA glycosylase YcaQ family protein [Anaerolineales bacterium]
MQITRKQARRFLLGHQGLQPPHQYLGKPGILEYIRRVGCIQYDPLNIVGHNPELVLQSRVAGFRPDMLKELLYEDRLLLDGWDKQMSIYCLADWPYLRRWREAARGSSHRSAEAVRAILPEVRAAIEARGPLSSLDLEMGELVDWDWAQSRLARAALESMYFWGELVIHHRVHTRKVYDFARRWLPGELLDAPDPNQTEEQYQDWYVRRRIGSVGLLWSRSGEAWLGMHQIKSQERKAGLERLVTQGELSQAHVEGIKEPFYFRCSDRPRLERTLEMDGQPPQAAVLAPLDNLLWDRRMLKEMFGFDYRWEVYTPPEKRRYGYYVLPVLYGDRFIARFEPGNEKKRGVLAIKNWWWEPGITPSEQMKADLVVCFRRFTRYLGVERLEISLQDQAQGGMEWLALSDD